MKKKENKMNRASKETGIEKSKIELIKLRIKNKFYNRDDVLKHVVSEIIKVEFNKSK